MDDKIMEYISKLQTHQSNANLNVIKQLEKEKASFEQNYLNAIRKLDEKVKDQHINKEFEAELVKLKAENVDLTAKYKELQDQLTECNKNMQLQRSKDEISMTNALRIQETNFIQRENLLHQQMDEMSERYKCETTNLEDHYKVIVNESHDKLKKLMESNYKLSTEITSLTSSLQVETAIRGEFAPNNALLAEYKEQLGLALNEIARLQEEKAALARKSSPSPPNIDINSVFNLPAPITHENIRAHYENIDKTPVEFPKLSCKMTNSNSFMPGTSFGRKVSETVCVTRKTKQVVQKAVTFKKLNDYVDSSAKSTTDKMWAQQKSKKKRKLCSEVMLMAEYENDQ